MEAIVLTRFAVSSARTKMAIFYVPSAIEHEYKNLSKICDRNSVVEESGKVEDVNKIIVVKPPNPRNIHAIGGGGCKNIPTSTLQHAT